LLAAWGPILYAASNSQSPHKFGILPWHKVVSNTPPSSYKVNSTGIKLIVTYLIGKVEDQK